LKTKVAVMILITLILLCSCTAPRTDHKAILRDPESPIPVGHYSLHYMPEKEAAPEMSQVSSRATYSGSLFDVRHGRAMVVRPRFGRSLWYACRENGNTG